MTTLIWDASALLHASLIDGLESLGDLASGPANDQWRNHTTAAVAQEVNERGGRIPEWLKVVHVDAIEELLVLAAWVSRVSSATHSRGEATVLAWAECHGAIAIVDDAARAEWLCHTDSRCTACSGWASKRSFRVGGTLGPCVDSSTACSCLARATPSRSVASRTGLETDNSSIELGRRAWNWRSSRVPEGRNASGLALIHALADPRRSK